MRGEDCEERAGCEGGCEERGGCEGVVRGVVRREGCDLRALLDSPGDMYTRSSVLPRPPDGAGATCPFLQKSSNDWLIN